MSNLFLGIYRHQLSSLPVQGRVHEWFPLLIHLPLHTRDNKSSHHLNLKSKSSQDDTEWCTGFGQLQDLGYHKCFLPDEILIKTLFECSQQFMHKVPQIVTVICVGDIDWVHIPLFLVYWVVEVYFTYWRISSMRLHSNMVWIVRRLWFRFCMEMLTFPFANFNNTGSSKQMSESRICSHSRLFLFIQPHL